METKQVVPFDYDAGEASWQEFLAARDAGGEVEITEAMFYYWLEVLPPVFMNRSFKFNDGQTVRASFGFAEGAEAITVFWRKDNQFFCRLSTIINPYA